MMLKPFIMDHPLIQHKVTLLRDKNTGSKEFRELINEVAMLMCYEATRDMPVKQIEIETPICIAKANVISGRKVAFIPIKARGCRSVKFMCIIAAPEGIEALAGKHPDVQIYCGALDDRLNENKYIVPGLGDAGDRIFGTK